MRPAGACLDRKRAAETQNRRPFNCRLHAAAIRGRLRAQDGPGRTAGGGPARFCRRGTAHEYRSRYERRASRGDCIRGARASAQYGPIGARYHANEEIESFATTLRRRCPRLPKPIRPLVPPLHRLLSSFPRAIRPATSAAPARTRPPPKRICSPPRAKSWTRPSETPLKKSAAFSRNRATPAGVETGRAHKISRRRRACCRSNWSIRFSRHFAIRRLTPFGKPCKTIRRFFFFADLDGRGAQFIWLIESWRGQIRCCHCRRRRDRRFDCLRTCRRKSSRGCAGPRGARPAGIVGRGRNALARPLLTARFSPIASLP